MNLEEQSSDIAQGVDKGDVKELGAGDQGLMFGYAVDETDSLMPASLMFAHGILQTLAKARKSGQVGFLKPDAKSQISVEYQGDHVTRVDTVVVSTMHSPSVTLKEVTEFVRESVIKNVIPSHFLDKKTKYFINPTGRFVIGGPKGDCGLTGRKIIVDTYGGHGAHGGGAFSWKDPTKVDRSGAYMARYMAKSVVAAGLAKKALVQLAYAIGVAEPVSIHVQTFGTESVPRQHIEKALLHLFRCKPQDIIDQFDLQTPVKRGFRYRDTAVYGHFGRSEFPWEALDKVSVLKAFV